MFESVRTCVRACARVYASVRCTRTHRGAVMCLFGICFISSAGMRYVTALHLHSKQPASWNSFFIAAMRRMSPDLDKAVQTAENTGQYDS